MSSWDDVGGNPCPGDVGVLSSHADALQSVGDHGRDVESRLSDLHSGMGSLRWAGAGAQNIEALVQQTVPNLATFWTAHHDAASALRTFVGQLEDLQGQSRAALADYSSAVSDLAAASNAAGDASGRYSAADGQVTYLDRELHGLAAERLLAVAAHQPTTSIDHRVATLTTQRNYQSGQRAQASNDASSAKSRIADAQTRKDSAQRRIDALRDETRGDAKSAATGILATIGVVHSSNPFVRSWDDVVGGAEAAGNWLNDNTDVLMQAWDDVTGWVGMAALVCTWIPVVGEILGVAAGAMTVADVAGHLLMGVAGKETWREVVKEVGLTVAFKAAGGGIGAALGKLSNSESKFDDTLGIVKRLGWFDDSRTATGFSSSAGKKLFATGKFEVRFHVYAAPKNITGPDSVYKTLLRLKAGLNLADHGKDIREVFTGPTHAARESTHDLRGSAQPIGPIPGGGVQGSDLPLQGSSAQVQG